jgi:hypothetical protein
LRITKVLTELGDMCLRLLQSPCACHRRMVTYVRAFPMRIPLNRYAQAPQHTRLQRHLARILTGSTPRIRERDQTLHNTSKVIRDVAFGTLAIRCVRDTIGPVNNPSRMRYDKRVRASWVLWQRKCCECTKARTQKVKAIRYDGTD